MAFFSYNSKTIQISIFTMSRTNKQFKISSLIVKKIFDQLSDEEQAELTQWVNSGNKHIYNNIFSSKNFESYKNDINEIDVNKAWEEYKTKNYRLETLKKRIIPILMRYAAAVTIFVLVAGTLYYVIQNDYFKENTTEVAKSVITPGEKKAELILSNGQKIILDDQQGKTISEEEGSTIVNDSLSLNYQNINSTAQTAGLFNELHVKRGWEYQLVLEDGTKVWINSMSVLKYPICFSEDTRVVELSGEAYFEVAHNPDKPFIVNTPSYAIEVLGTSFNVCDFDEDEISYTTLASGKVNIAGKFLTSDENKTFELSPNEQFFYNKTQMKTGVKTVDALIYSSWKDGYFEFEDEPLEIILNRLTRWYEADVFFDNDQLRHELYSGKLPRFENLEVILEMMEKVSDVKFKMQIFTIPSHDK